MKNGYDMSNSHKKSKSRVDNSDSYGSDNSFIICDGIYSMFDFIMQVKVKQQILVIIFSIYLYLYGQ